MRMKWLPAGIGLFLVGMSVVSFADERVYEQAEFPHEICGTWTDIHGGRTLEIAPRAVDGDLLDGMVFHGDTPGYGISYTDGNGRTRRFYIGMSGDDGSLFLGEF